MKLNIIFLFAILLFLSACAGITNIEVTRVDPDKPAKGIVYYLPKPILNITPQGDGTLEATFEFIPDPDNAYAINSKTYLGKQTLDIQLTEKGFLKSLDWKPDATLVAEGIKAASEIAKADLDRKLELKKEAETKKETEKQKQETALKEAKTNLKSAEQQKQTQTELIASLESQLKILQLELEQIQAKPTADQSVLDQNEIEIFKKQEAIRIGKERGDDVTQLESDLAVLQRQREQLLSNQDSRNTLIQQKQMQIFQKQEEIRLANEKLGTIEANLASIQGEIETVESTLESYGPANEPGDASAGESTNTYPSAWGGMAYHIFEGIALTGTYTDDKGNLRYTHEPTVVLKPVYFNDGQKPAGQLSFSTIKPFPANKTTEYSPVLSHQDAGGIYQSPFSSDTITNAKLAVNTSMLRYEHAVNSMNKFTEELEANRTGDNWSPKKEEQALTELAALKQAVETRQLELVEAQQKLKDFRMQASQTPITFTVISDKDVGSVGPLGTHKLCMATGKVSDDGFDTPPSDGGTDIPPPAANAGSDDNSTGSDSDADSNFAGGGDDNEARDTVTPVKAINSCEGPEFAKTDISVNAILLNKNTIRLVLPSVGLDPGEYKAIIAVKDKAKKTPANPTITFVIR